MLISNNSSLLHRECLSHHSHPFHQTKLKTTFFLRKEEFASSLEHDIAAQATPLLRDILDNEGTSPHQLQALYKKIVTYIMVAGGLDDHKHIPASDVVDTKFSSQSDHVFTEVTAAFASVFPECDVLKFQMLARHAKEVQLKDHVGLVAGIRLFNKYIGKGGAHIANGKKIQSKGNAKE